MLWCIRLICLNSAANFSAGLCRGRSLSRPMRPEPMALRVLDLWHGGTANRFGRAPGPFPVYGLLGTSLLSLPAEPIRMFWKLSPLVATGKLCFLPVPRNSWRGCWQLAALPLRSALWDETCRISLFSSFFFFFLTATSHILLLNKCFSLIPLFHISFASLLIAAQV